MLQNCVVNFVVCITLFDSAVDGFESRRVMVSLVGPRKGEILVVALFGSSGAFETLAAGLLSLSAASPVPGGASGVAIVVASEATALAKTGEFSGAPLTLTAGKAYEYKKVRKRGKGCIYLKAIPRVVRQLGLHWVRSLHPLRSQLASWAAHGSFLE
jgi:hypothetical protein